MTIRDLNLYLVNFFLIEFFHFVREVDNDDSRSRIERIHSTTKNLYDLQK
jgi:hypothetical protein